MKKKRHGYLARAIETDYWMPGDDYCLKIADAIREKIEKGDIIAVSEKALSTAKGRIIDEEKVVPRSLAKFLARFWMRIVWGYFLGFLCHLKAENIRRLRNYPLREGATHKQVALRYSGVLNSLMWGSEGGIDGSNLPYAYVSLPLTDAQDTAEQIREFLRNRFGKNIAVMIVDTDKTYSMRNFHFTHRPISFRAIHPFFGFIAYVLGRALRLKSRSTPIVITGQKTDVDKALDLSEAAHKTRGSGAGRTVWDMAFNFNVQITQVTWYMLKSLKHKPIVIFRLSSPTTPAKNDG